jgi:hypothetical protein
MCSSPSAVAEWYNTPRSVLSRVGRDGRGRSRWSLHDDQRGIRRARPRWDKSQHHWYRKCSNEALYPLCATESSSTIPAPRRRPTTSTSTVKRRNRESYGCQRKISAKKEESSWKQSFIKASRSSRSKSPVCQDWKNDRCACENYDDEYLRLRSAYVWRPNQYGARQNLRAWESWHGRWDRQRGRPRQSGRLGLPAIQYCLWLLRKLRTSTRLRIWSSCSGHNLRPHVWMDDCSWKGGDNMLKIKRVEKKNLSAAGCHGPSCHAPSCHAPACHAPACHAPAWFAWTTAAGLLELIRPPFFCPFRGCKPEPPKFPDVRVEKAPIFTDIWICELAEWHTADTILQIVKTVSY